MFNNTEDRKVVLRIESSENFLRIPVRGGWLMVMATAMVICAGLNEKQSVQSNIKLLIVEFLWDLS